MPEPSLAKVASLQTCPIVTTHVMEAFRTLLAVSDRSGARLVYTRPQYVDFIDQRLPTLVDPAYTASLALELGEA